MSKKIKVLNSPWNRDYERPSDCERWLSKQQAYPNRDGSISFTKEYFDAVRTERINAMPFEVGNRDGIQRRWVTRSSGGIGVKQLRPINQVGTGSGVTRNPDKLKRRQARIPKPVVVEIGPR